MPSRKKVRLAGELVLAARSMLTVCMSREQVCLRKRQCLAARISITPANEKPPVQGNERLRGVPRVGDGSAGSAWRGPIAGSGDHRFQRRCLALDPCFEALRLAAGKRFEVIGDAR